MMDVIPRVPMCFDSGLTNVSSLLSAKRRGQPHHQLLDRLARVQNRRKAVICKYVRGDLREYMIGSKEAKDTS
jgi:hypothetical protein